MTETYVVDQEDQKDSFIEQLASTLNIASTSKMIFYEAIKEDDVTIIPVAKVRYGFGGGYGNKQKEKAGIGGGGGVDAVPVGYIEIKEGRTQFKRIRLPHSVPALIVAGGFAGFLLFRGLTKLLRK